jgi:hypothetical protein
VAICVELAGNCSREALGPGGMGILARGFENFVS